MPETYEGFIVHAYAASGRGKPRLHLIGRLTSGKTFAVVEERERPGFYLRRSDIDRVQSLIGNGGFAIEECGMRTFDGEGCLRVLFDSVERCRRSAENLAVRDIRTYEADIRFPDQFLMRRGVHCSVAISGTPSAGRRVDLVFVNPEIAPSSRHPSLTVLSLDIETDPRGERIYAIGLVLRGQGFPKGRDGSKEPGSFQERREVLLSRPTDVSREVTSFPDERSMLEAFCDRVIRWDPDILTGWNVIDFDFPVIANAMKRLEIPFSMGRSDEASAFLPGGSGKSNTVIIHGRQVLDALRVVRASPERFDDYTLETVAMSVLGRGKAIDLGEEERRPEAIARMYAEDPAGLCRYCLEDAILVLDILESTGLMDLTLSRSNLVGISLERAWTSIPAFERLYIEALHQRGVVAPSPGVDPLPSILAPGGAILSPNTGLYDNVLTFDFRSLYPSIIRTFNIDPLSFVSPGAAETLSRKTGDLGDDERGALIRAPNGAFFSRESAILPKLLERFFALRDEAKQHGDDVASRVYKTIMNSFYGVLGAKGCRFASGYLSGAITGFGHDLLHWCERWFVGMGYRVLYGDTDSLFVLPGRPQGTPPEELEGLSRKLCEDLNADLSRYVSGTFGAISYLELEFEKVYYRFFIPPVRGAGGDEDKVARGRAKGYAGLLVPIGELRESLSKSRSDAHRSESEETLIEIVGMEAVRRDWTDLAKGFQVGLLRLVFAGAELASVRDFIRRIVAMLFGGELDKRLVYRKALRKPVSAYTHSTPPHVKAAEMLDPGERRGLVRYLWTREGPQPEGKLTAPIDYDHYVEKQLKPIAQSFAEVLGTGLEHLFSGGEQLRLF